MLRKSSVACITGILEPSEFFFFEPPEEQDTKAKLRNNGSLSSITPVMQA